MPKKFQGENTKSAVARARKAEAQSAKAEAKAKAEEDAKWADETTEQKFAKKEEMARRKQEQLEKKKALKAMADAEMEAAAASASTKQKPPAPKVTHAQLNAQRERQQAERLAQSQNDSKSKIVVQDEDAPIEENINRLQIDGEQARTVDEAIAVLRNSSDTPEVDIHPEKRMRAAYTAFEEWRLPQLKNEHPTFRLSQLRQLLKKEWQKSPDNPLNQRLAALNADD